MEGAGRVVELCGKVGQWGILLKLVEFGLAARRANAHDVLGGVVLGRVVVAAMCSESKKCVSGIGGNVKGLCGGGQAVCGNKLTVGWFLCSGSSSSSFFRWFR